MEIMQVENEFIALAVTHDLGIRHILYRKRLLGHVNYYMKNKLGN